MQQIIDSPYIVAIIGGVVSTIVSAVIFALLKVKPQDATKNELRLKPESFLFSCLRLSVLGFASVLYLLAVSLVIALVLSGASNSVFSAHADLGLLLSLAVVASLAFVDLLLFIILFVDNWEKSELMQAIFASGDDKSTRASSAKRVGQASVSWLIVSCLTLDVFLIIVSTQQKLGNIITP